PEISQKGPNRSELPRRGRARLTLTMDVGEKGAERAPIEPRRIERRRVDAGCRRRVVEELREIALVGPDRVSRRVAVKREKLQERFELCVHGATSADRPAHGPKARACARPCFAAHARAAR